MPRIVNYPLSTRDQKKRQVTFDWDFVSAGYADYADYDDFDYDNVVAAAAASTSKAAAKALDDLLDSVDFEPQQW